MKAISRGWFFVLIVVLGILAPLLSHSNSTRTCLSGLLTDIIEEHKKGFLTEADSQKISHLYDSSDLTDKEKALKIFEVVLDSRLRSLPSQDAEKIRKTFRGLKKKITDSDVNGFYMSLGKGYMGINIPERYLGTAVEYKSIVHELEHAIHHLALKRSDVREPLFSLRLPLFSQVAKETSIRLRFLQEEAAMRAEWLYLNTLPTKLRISILDEVMRDPKLNSSSKMMLIGALRASFYDADRYLKIIRNDGRYSMENIEENFEADQRPFKIVLGAYMGISGIIIMLSALKSICETQIDEEGNVPNTKYFNHICLKISLVRGIIESRSKPQEFKDQH